MKKELVKVGMKVKATITESTKFVSNLKSINKHTSFIGIVTADADKRGFFEEKGYYEIDVHEVDGVEYKMKVMINCADFEPYEEPKEDIAYGDLVSFQGVLYYVEEVLNDSIRVAQVEGIIKRWLKTSDVKKVYLNPNWGKKPKEVGYKVKSHMFNGSDDFGYSYTLTFNKSMECISKHKGIEMGLDAFDKGDHLPITQEFIESFGFAKESENTFTKPYGGNVFIELSFSDDCWTLELNSNKKNFVTEPSDIVFQNFTCTTQSELRFLLTKGRIDCSK